ncbi:hypothetical protein BGZ80_007879, partial [Entomortierella chlamydospora]
MAFKRVSSALRLLCFVLALSGLCNSAPRSQFSMNAVEMQQYHPQDDTKDDGYHVNTHEVEITLTHPHSFMELYGWIPHMTDGISQIRMSTVEPCADFSIQIVEFHVCQYDRGLTMDVGAFGIRSSVIACADVNNGCTVTAINGIAGKVGATGLCIGGN